MIHILRNWLRKRPENHSNRSPLIRWSPQKELSTTPQSKPMLDENMSLWSLKDEYIPPPGVDPRMLFPMLRRLRDYIPDVSAGVWAWVRLCSTQQSYTLGESVNAEQRRAHRILEDLDRRVCGCQPGRAKGIEFLVQSFFTSVFTYGSFCGEVVLNDTRQRIERFLIIDPATVRFKLDLQTRSFLPYQIQGDGSYARLNPASFFYYGLDTDGLTPYGRSPLLALPLVVRLQQQLLHDMTRAQHNAGYPTIHFKIATGDRISGENPNNYNERLNEAMDQLRAEVDHMQTDSNLITSDRVEVQYIGPSGNALQWSESIQAITEQVISALHLAPFMIGRNWGTTQSWGTAQYQLLTNNARTVQEGAKRLAEWLRNLELLLQGSPLSVSHQFAPHHHLDVYDRARAFKTSAETLVHLSEKGIIDAAAAKQRIENLLKFL